MIRPEPTRRTNCSNFRLLLRQLGKQVEICGASDGSIGIISRREETDRSQVHCRNSAGNPHRQLNLTRHITADLRAMWIIYRKSTIFVGKTDMQIFFKTYLLDLGWAGTYGCHNRANTCLHTRKLKWYLCTCVVCFLRFELRFFLHDSFVSVEPSTILIRIIFRDFRTCF